MAHIPLPTRNLATATLAGLVAFPLLVTVLHVVQRDSYDPAAQAISELALGRAGWLMGIAFTVSGLAVLGFGVLIRRTDPGAVAVPVLATGSGVCTMLSAEVRADPETASTVHGAVHQLLGVLSFALLVAAMFVCARRFRRVPLWRALALPSLVWGIAATAAFLLVPLQVLGPAHFGIAQRIFLAVWLAWPITLTAYARRHVGRPVPVGALAGVPRTAD